jgi:hypothetical protein
LGTILAGALDAVPEPARLTVLPDADRAGALAEGALTITSLGTDLAIAGTGFFVLEDPANGALAVTRVGHFQLDDAGYLVGHGGRRVQGYSDAALTARGDIRVNREGCPATADPAATVSSFVCDWNGKLNVRLSDEMEFCDAEARLLPQRFYRAITTPIPPQPVSTNAPQPVIPQ